MNKHTRIWIILAVLAAAFTLTACTGSSTNIIVGTGRNVSVEKSFSGIRGVAVGNQGELVIELGDLEHLTIEAQENIQPYIEVELVNGVLTINTQKNTNLRPTQTIRYLLTVISLESLSVNSSGGITAPALEADHFQLNINSSGDIYLAGLTADSLDVTVSSSGDIEIAAGQVDTQEVTINSSGHYIAGNLRSQEAVVDINSSGSATVWVVDRLRATIQSSGDVNYYGAADVSSAITSSGDVNYLGDK